MQGENVSSIVAAQVRCRDALRSLMEGCSAFEPGAQQALRLIDDALAEDRLEFAASCWYSMTFALWSAARDGRAKDCEAAIFNVSQAFSELADHLQMETTSSFGRDSVLLNGSELPRGATYPVDDHGAVGRKRWIMGACALVTIVIGFVCLALAGMAAEQMARAIGQLLGGLFVVGGTVGVVRAVGASATTVRRDFDRFLRYM